MERWIMMTQTPVSYHLTVIEEEQVPLSAYSVDTSNTMMILLSVLVTVVLIAGLYVVKCRYYQKRIEELDVDGLAYRGWRLLRLRETVTELEAEKIEKKFLENVSLFA